MMLPAAYQQLVSAIDELPAIGPRAASRLAQHLLISGRLTVLREALDRAAAISLCSRCRLFTCSDVCSVCADEDRDAGRILVVAGMDDVMQAEGIGWQGRYFVLHGLLSPMAGLGPSQLGLSALANLAARADVHRIIIALDESAEGRATSVFIRQLLQSDTAEVSELSWQRWYDQECAG